MPRTRRSLPPVPRQRLVDSVIERLEADVRTGRFKPGERLPTENELTRALGVSRTTLREAVGALAHAGLLDVRQGDGTYVTADPGETPLGRRLRRAAALDVYEVRRALELEAAKLAAERRTAADVRALRTLVRARTTHRAAGRTAEFVEADLRLHLAIARASRNAVLVELYQAFAGPLRQTLVDVITDPQLTADTGAWHETLVEAIAARDATAAARAADQLLRVDAELLRAALGRGAARRRS